MSTVIKLSELNWLGFSIQGGATEDRAGVSVSSLGDIDGDGFDDVIIGAAGGGLGGIRAGQAYVIFGKAEGLTTVNLLNLAPPQGLVIQGDAEGDYAGRSVSSAGDINGDGFNDIVIGAPYADEGGLESGAVYVIFGKPDGLGAIDLTDLAPEAGFIIKGATSSDYVGRSASGAGDINGDNIDDLIVGAMKGGPNSAGEAFVIYGKRAGHETVDLANLTSTDGFIMKGSAGDYAGGSVSSAGDINGDGFDDVIVGAHGGDGDYVQTGAAFVVFGAAEGLGTVDLTDLEGAEGFVIRGHEPGDSAGRSVSSAGDFNGDGFDDVIVGAPNGDESGDDAGQAYVIFGKAEGLGPVGHENLAPEVGFLILGGEAYDSAAISVSGAGDVNGDGYDDLIVGANGAGNDGSVNAGAAYVIFGRSGEIGTLNLGNLAPTDGFIIRSDVAHDAAGFSVSSAGDINNDGYGDVIVGAMGRDAGAVDSGAAYVIYGGDHLLPISWAGSAGDDSETGGISDDHLWGGDGNDVLDGWSGQDVLDGASGTDTASYATAGRAVNVDLEIGGQQDTMGAGIDTLISIENLEGSSFSDQLMGSEGDNLLLGRDANDSLQGRLGNDVLNGGAGIDVADYGSAASGVQARLTNAGPQDTGAAGVDTLLDIENLRGSSFDDLLEGDAGNNTLDGREGADRLRGNEGADTLLGGAGVDLAIYAGAAKRVFVDLELTGRQNTGAGSDLLSGIENLIGSDFSDQLSGNGGANGLNGGLGHDRLSGRGGADTLRGGDGNDVLTGGAGPDQTRGESGSDVYHVDHALDRVIEEVGDGFDTVHSSVSFTLAANLEKLVLVGSALRGTGNGLGNELVGTDAANILAGGGGDDRASAGSGNDFLYGGAGRDRLAGSAGLDRFHFDTAPNATTNLDQLVDFAASDDTIMLDRAVFAGLGADGVLAPSAFRTGTRAADADDRIVYNSANGLIYYDADGLGGTAQVAFARVAAGTGLTRADFRGYSSAASASAAQVTAPLFEDPAGEQLMPVRPMPEFRLDGPEHHMF